MNPTSSPASGTTRRQLIRTGAFGAAAAAFLAACGTKSDKKAGQSGDDPTTTEVAPEAPMPEASEADLAYDTDLLRTATSMELLAADLYDEYGPKLSDEQWKTEFARFAADHGAAADEFRQETPVEHRVDDPNEWLIENSVKPVEDQLDSGSDAVILEFFALLESTFAATYITAVSSFSQVEGRAQFAGFAEAAARRNAVMGNGGEGAAPQAALYPLQDLIPNEAYVTVVSADAGVAADSEDEGQS
ncbi:MAG TPA: hypothetical protein VNS19_11315 [Acidimicrobiales bacterium]|nr:hypothetical protein [Acidimicrobiales bacterium]